MIIELVSGIGIIAQRFNINWLHACKGKQNEVGKTRKNV